MGEPPSVAFNEHRSGFRFSINFKSRCSDEQGSGTFGGDGIAELGILVARASSNFFERSCVNCVLPATFGSGINKDAALVVLPHSGVGVTYEEKVICQG